MSFNEETKHWYFTVKTMNDNLESKRLYAYFLTTNYQNIENGNYKWKNGFEPRDEKALLRLLNADLMSHVIRNLESLLSLARVGILAQKKGICHERRNTWYFSKSMKKLGEISAILEENNSLEIWKWVLWILDPDEIAIQLNLSSNEKKVISKVYDSMLERTEFVFNYAAKFWNLYKPVRNAFSHTFNFVSFPETSIKIPAGYDDAILVFGHNWTNNHPVEMAILSGSYPILEMANAIAAFNLFEKIILENHVRSIQLDSKRIISNHMIVDINKDLFSKYMSILQKTPKLRKINVDFQYNQGFNELKKQDEIYRNFRKILSQLGRKTPYRDVREPFQPTRKETRKLK